MQEAVLQGCHRHSPVCAAVCGILNLPENDDVAVLGTVYKDMKLKPSILDEYVKVSRDEAHASERT